MNGSRTRKKAPFEVIIYEIEMLQHCFDVLRKPPRNQAVRNVYIESYLLHYRNLIEFFGSDSPRRDDITVRRPQEWSTRPLTAADISSITSLGEPLWNQWRHAIGKQLHHCTHPRYLTRHEWPLAAMHRDLGDVLNAFSKLKAI